MVAWGSALTSGSWTTGPLRTYTHYPIDETLDSLQGSQWFSSLDLKSGYWQVEMDEESKPLTVFTVEPLAFMSVKGCPHYIPEADGNLSLEPPSPLVHNLLRWHSHLLQRSIQPPWEARGCSPETEGGWTQTQAFQMWAILMADCLLGACDLCPRSNHWWGQNWSYQEQDQHPQMSQRSKVFWDSQDITVSLSLNLCRWPKPCMS